MVVGAGERHHLTDAQRGAHFRRHALILSGIIDGAHGNDRALAGHQPWDGLHGSHGAGIGDRNCSALKIGRAEFAGASAAHQVVEGRDVCWEIDLAGVFDIRDQQIAPAVFAGHIDGDTQIDVSAHDAERLTGFFRVSVIQPRKIFERAHDRPADDVGVGNFGLAQQRAVVIDDAPVFVDHFYRDRPLRSRERDGQTHVHVVGDAGRSAAHGHPLFAGRAFYGCRDGFGYLGGGRCTVATGLLEYVLPALIDRAVIAQVLLV